MHTVYAHSDVLVATGIALKLVAKAAHGNGLVLSLFVAFYRSELCCVCLFTCKKLMAQMLTFIFNQAQFKLIPNVRVVYTLLYEYLI